MIFILWTGMVFRGQITKLQPLLVIVAHSSTPMDRMTSCYPALLLNMLEIGIANASSPTKQRG